MGIGLVLPVYPQHQYQWPGGEGLERGWGDNDNVGACSKIITDWTSRVSLDGGRPLATWAACNQLKHSKQETVSPEAVKVAMLTPTQYSEKVPLNRVF